MPVKVTCDYCGKEFTKYPCQVTKRNFCSQSCYFQTISKYNNPNYSGGKYIKCEICGKYFWIRPSRKGKARFCSDKCKNTAHSREIRGENHPNWKGGIPKGKVEKICLNCGKPYYGNSRSSFCSRKCRSEHYFVQNGHIIRCEYCGKELKRNKFEYEKVKHHFCSRKCSYCWHKENKKAKGGSVEKTCQYCGKIFFVKPSKKETAKYCSHSCEAKNRVGERSPNWKGGHPKYYGATWKKQRERALRRDNYTCQNCGATGVKLHVHHIKSKRDFKDPEKANRLDNLITLCMKCHNNITDKKERWEHKKRRGKQTAIHHFIELSFS